jgi:hypothetical protein
VRRISTTWYSTVLPVPVLGHVRDVIQIIEEGAEPLPRCSKCGITQKDVGRKHQETTTCKKYALRALRLELQNTYGQSLKLAAETKFTVFGETIEQVHEFKYLGRLVTDTDDDRDAVISNLEKAMRNMGTVTLIIVKGKGTQYKSGHVNISINNPVKIIIR